MATHREQFFMLVEKRIAAPPKGSLISEFVKIITKAESDPELMNLMINEVGDIHLDKRKHADRLSKNTLMAGFGLPEGALGSVNGPKDLPAAMAKISKAARKVDVRKVEKEERRAARIVIARLHAARFFAHLHRAGMESLTSAKQEILVKNTILGEALLVLLQDQADREAVSLLSKLISDLAPKAHLKKLQLRRSASFAEEGDTDQEPGMAGMAGASSRDVRHQLAEEVAQGAVAAFTGNPPDFLVAKPTADLDLWWGYLTTCFQNKLKNSIEVETNQVSVGGLKERTARHRQHQGVPRIEPGGFPLKRAGAAKQAGVATRTVKRMEERRQISPTKDAAGNVWFTSADMDTLLKVLKEGKTGGKGSD